MSAIDWLRKIVRTQMNQVARALNDATNGRLSPNMVTLFGLAMHVPISLLIAKGYFGKAALLLVIFGLFDALDGELARLQKKASAAGMLLDATTDRMKEVLLFAGIGFYFTERYTYTTEQLFLPQWLTLDSLIAVTILALGGSLLVSYVKAKGETVVAGGNLSANEVNRLFQNGLMRFEVRMAILIIALLCGMKGLVIAVFFLTVANWLTVISRLITISRKIR